MLKLFKRLLYSTRFSWVVLYFFYLQNISSTSKVQHPYKQESAWWVGKAETIGKGEGNLSVNISKLDSDTSKFARWGDNYAYHIGDLSAVSLPGHESKYIQRKYQSWAEALFQTYPAEEPTLKQPVYFFAKAWRSLEVGPWIEFGATRLTFLKYQLIGLASAAFGEVLLNREGKNRD